MRVALLSHNAQTGDAIGNQLAEKLAFFLERGADARIFVESDRDLHPAVRPHCHTFAQPQPRGPEWEFIADADLVIAEYGQFYPLLHLLPLLAGGRPRILVDYHGVTPPELWGPHPHEPLSQGLRQRGLLCGADAVLAHSRYIHRELTGPCGLLPERVHRLGFPVNLDQFRPVKAEGGRRKAEEREKGIKALTSAFRLPPSAFRLLFVGRLGPNKRVPVLIEALARLRDLSPPVHALVAGTTTDLYGDETRRCRELAEQLGVADRLHLLGHLTGQPLLDAYRSADVLVLPSLWESFCIPAVEAMACGVPVVAARTTALPETLGAAGLTFKPDDAADLEWQLHRILDCGLRIADCGSIGRGQAINTSVFQSAIRNPQSAIHKVALVSFRYGTDFPGGAETSLRTIAAVLTKAGCAVEVFTTCTRDESTWTDELPEGRTQVDGVPVHRFRLDAHDRSRHLEAVRAAWQAGADATPEMEREYLRHSVHSTRLLDALRRRADEFDAVLTGPYLYGLTHDVATALPEKTLVLPCFHDEPLAHLPVCRAAFERVGGLLYHSAEEQEFAQAVLGLNHPGAACIGTALDTDTLGDAEAGKRAVAAPSGRYVVYAGRYSPSKELPLLTEYARRYAERCPGRFTFAFMGQGGVTIPAESWARDLGFVSEARKRDVLAGADALLLPSRNESLSLVALEAWAQGTPVVANAACAVLVGHLERSGGGWAVDGYEAFAQTLDALWTGSEPAREKGRAGQAYVRAEYGSRAAFAERLLRAIVELRVPLAARMRRRGLERAAGFSRAAWRAQFARVVEQVLDTGPRPYREQVEVRPRADTREAPAGARAVLVSVRVVNRGTHPLVADGPARTVLRCRVVDERGHTTVESSEGTPLPALLPPGRALAAAVSVPVPPTPGVYRVVFWAQRADCRVPITDRKLADKEIGSMLLSINPQSAIRNPQLGDGCSGPALEAVEAALIEADRLRRLPDNYTDVTEGVFASLKRRVKRKLLGNFKHAYVDVLSRQQSGFNAELVTAVRELSECCATLDHALRVLLQRVAELERQGRGDGPGSRSVGLMDEDKFTEEVRP